MQSKDITKLKDQVGFVLENRPKTRNSDELLIHEVCAAFPQRDKVRHASSIERCRRSYNQAGKYLPTDEEVAAKRKLNIDEWREALGYPPREIDRFV